jgi:GAF domain-containing protein
MRSTEDLEKRALELAREAAQEHRVYADLIARLDAVIREAYQRGGEAIAAELADAYSLFIVNDDDLDSFRDALTERLPPGWKVPKPRRRGAVMHFLRGEDSSQPACGAARGTSTRVRAAVTCRACCRTVAWQREGVRS